MAIYTILTSMVNDFTKKINHIANKCDKQGIPYTYIVGDPYDKQVDVEGKHYILSVTDINLDIQFKFNGWVSLGLVQRKDGITQCYLKTQELIKQYCHTDFHCDHCHKHVHRNSVVILEHENGDRKVVGTSCVKDFTCGLDGNLIATYNDIEVVLAKRNSEMNILLQGESLDDLPVSVFCERNGHPVYDVDRVVSCAVRMINSYGFEPSCSDDATWKLIPSVYAKTDIEDEAVKAIDWVKSLTEDEVTKSSYLFNLKQIVEAGYCTYRHFGLLASLIPTYRKEIVKIMNESRRAVSNYVGNVGEKFSWELTYTKSISYESQYGTGFFHFFVDEVGNVYKWSTNKSIFYKIYGLNYTLDQGSTVKLSGFIKDHEEYRGEKQTIITRCKYEVIKSEAKEAKIKELSQPKPDCPKDDLLDSLMSSWG